MASSEPSDFWARRVTSLTVIHLNGPIMIDTSKATADACAREIVQNVRASGA